MSSLAHILLDKGYEVVGVDTCNYVYTEDSLFKRNVIIKGFNELNINQDDILIYGHSFKENEEVIKGKKICNLSYEYHEYVNKLASESKLSIAIAGSHGKTYTTGLISYILSKLGNVSYLIGDGEGRYINNDVFVFEACEYQDHFLIYHPDISIILNIDYDHSDYFNSIEQYKESFSKFVSNSKKVILNSDDVNIRSLDVKDAFYFSLSLIKDLKLTNNGYSFKLNNTQINTNVYGEKHILNILSLITLCDYLGIEKNEYIHYIKEFSGVKRRFRETIINGDIYIDDYAHHPSQIKYTLEMIKNKYPDKELVVFFKPDRISRFLTFYKQIATSLNSADYVVVMENSSGNEKIEIDLLLNENKDKFNKYSRTEIKKVKEKKNKVVVTLSSKSMNEVYENIFINTIL